MLRVNVTSPVGRIVMGSLYEPRKVDAEGKPLVIKNGPNAGQPRVDYFIALAIPKGSEQHWAHTAWGQIVWQVGNQAFPNAAQSPAFAWKIEDGDSQIPNKKGRKPCENEGWPGHWILKFSGGFAPKVYRQEGSGYVQLMEPGFVKAGYFVEIAFNVDGNGSQSQPGIYLNHSIVCFRAYGPEIQFGPDVASAGFGQAPLPAGASMTPPPSAIPAPQLPNAAAPAPANLHLPVGAVSTVMPPVPAANVPIPVTPNPSFVQVPPPLPQGGFAPPPAPPAPGRKMTPAAGGVTYEAYIAAGWNDVQLIQNGLMLA